MEPLQIIFIAIVLCILALGILEGLRRLPWIFWNRLPTDDYDEWDDEESDTSKVVAAPVAGSNNNGAIAQQPIAMPQNGRNALLHDGKVAALARMVVAKKVTQTEGIELVFGVKASGSNATYREIRDALKAELERLDHPQYPPLAEKERRVREWIEE